MSSAEHRWEWTLPDGAKIAATLDSEEKIESIFVGGALASQAARGSKPEGHVLEKPSGVVVRFQSGALICILRLDGEEVSPNVWPVRKRGGRPKPNVIAVPLRAIGVAVLALALIGGAIWIWSSRTSATEAAASMLDSTFRAENGRFVAHHPARFVGRRPLLPPGASGIVLLDTARRESIVLVAYAAADTPSEPWLVQKKLHAEALANLPRNGPAYEEASRGDEICLGKPGAVVLGKSRTAQGEAANVWSCGFVHDGAAYLVMYSIRADAASDDGRRLREIIEATELTRLAEIEKQ
jgi:hypothetical protein